jgi:hypothetical protein
MWQVNAEASFLLNAAQQAVTALRLVPGGPRFGAEMQAKIRLLRNVFEHWDETHPAVVSPPVGPSIKEFAERWPNGSPWGAGFGVDHQLSVMRVEDLWEELDRVERELGRIRNAAYEGTNEPYVADDADRPPRPFPWQSRQ